MSIASSSASTEIIISTFSPAFCHASKPPLRYPSMVAKPTRANRITVSSSLPFSVISNNGLLKGNRLPAHSAKRPSRPIKILPGTNPSVKIAAGLVSTTNMSSLILFLNAATVKAVRPFALISSRLL